MIFITLALTDYLLDNRQFISNTKFAFIAIPTTLMWGLIALSDSFYIYMFFVPVALFSALAYFKTKEMGYKEVLLLTLAGFISTALFYLIYNTLNYHNYPLVMRFDDYNNVIRKIANLPFTYFKFIGSNFFSSV